MDSRALEGDAWHHRSDAITSAAAAIGISIALVGGPKWAMADDWAALAACVIIVINGALIFRGALHEVLDGSPAPGIAQEIRNEAMGQTGVAGVEKCRVRKSGIGLFVELHVQVDGNTSVREGHRIGHAVKDHLKALKPEIIDVVIHLEPVD